MRGKFEANDICAADVTLFGKQYIVDLSGGGFWPVTFKALPIEWAKNSSTKAANHLNILISRDLFSNSIQSNTFISELNQLAILICFAAMPIPSRRLWKHDYPSQICGMQSMSSATTVNAYRVQTKTYVMKLKSAVLYRRKKPLWGIMWSLNIGTLTVVCDGLNSHTQMTMST